MVPFGLSTQNVFPDNLIYHNQINLNTFIPTISCHTPPGFVFWFCVFGFWFLVFVFWFLVLVFGFGFLVFGFGFWFWFLVLVVGFGFVFWFAVHLVPAGANANANPNANGNGTGPRGADLKMGLHTQMWKCKTPVWVPKNLRTWLQVWKKR